MPIRKYKPTSPARRQMTVLTFDEITTDKPHAPLTEKLQPSGGRNSTGEQTIWWRGGGHKRLYRIIDFKRDKTGIPGTVATIEYDPNRSSLIALINYADGEKRYILQPVGLKVGDAVIAGPSVDILTGNCLPLKNIPQGTMVHNVELKPGKGGQMARSAGASASFTAREGIYATLRLKSGESRKVHVDCRATIGEVSNDEHNLRVYGKAGAKRWLGIRPTVRGQAMNPVDHPHGGGEGKSGQGNPHPVSPWGQKAKGLKTRRNKRTTSMIVQRRQNRIR